MTQILVPGDFLDMARRGGNSPRVPLHLVISEKLREQIASGIYAPGEQLPSEFDLGAHFGVSRTTVRRAIANLINQGLVSTQQGKGAFVKEREKISFSLSNPLTFFDLDLVRQGILAKIQTIRFDTLQPSNEIRTRLGLPHSDSLIWQQQKIILGNQAPVALDIAYFPFEVGSQLKDQLQDGFTYATLDANGFPLNHADVMLEGTHATYEIGTCLEVPLGAPLLIYRYVAYTTGDRPIVCGDTLSPADRTCYSVKLKRHDLQPNL
ncbi:MAG: GntR family transcriptional regulator [Elainellaceae cyanobacterium]